MPDNDKVNPLVFHDENWNGKNDGIYFMNEGNRNEIVITKNDRQYVRGDQIYIQYNGIHIYAGLDEMIIINKATNVVNIKSYKELSPPEEREYLVLLHYYDEDEANIYQSCKGRQEVFDYLKSVIEFIDVDKSIILAETVSVKDSISVYKFMLQCCENELVDIGDDGFDINEYRIVFED